MGYFTERSWLDRVVQFFGRRRITIESQSATEIVGTLTREEGTVTTEGTPLSAANLNDLENRINTAFTAAENDIDGLTTETTETADKLDVLWKLSKGIIYDWQKTEVDGVVTVPSGAKSSVLQGLKGKSVVWNQLIENGNFEDTTGWATYGGTIATSNNVCTFTASNAVVNTSRLQTNLATVTGHKYYTTVSFKSSKATSAYVTTDGNSPLVLATNIQADTFTTLQFVSNAVVANGTLMRMYLNADGDFVEGDTIEISNVMVFDLTLMFGVGNEPRVEQFKAMFPNDYYPYTPNTLKSVSVSKFSVNSTDYPITFSGKSARTVRDEIDLVNKKYIQRVGSVDLGTLTWSTDGNSIWTSMGLSELIQSPASDGTVANVINALYTAVTSYQINSGDKLVAVNIVKRLRIRDTAFANASEFKEAMNGVMLYYELATPIETDITEEEITAITASGDTIVFDGEVAVGSIFNHFIALNEVNL